MSGLQNKNFLFYSLYPEDKLSRECLAAIGKNPKIKDQFIFVCIHNMSSIYEPPPYKLPKKIIEFKDNNIIPVLCVSGFSYFISGKHVLTWLNSTMEKELNGGLDCYNGGDSFADNCSTIDLAEMIDKEYFNSEYNLPSVSGKGEINKNYANIEEADNININTFENNVQNGSRKQASYEIQKQFEALQSERKNQSTQGPSTFGFNQQQRAPQAPQMPSQMPQQMPPQYSQQRGPQMPQAPPQQRGPQMPSGGPPQYRMPQQQQGGPPQYRMPQMPQMPQQGGQYRMPQQQNPFGQLQNRPFNSLDRHLDIAYSR